jgi:hypothetical protein
LLTPNPLRLKNPAGAFLSAESGCLGTSKLNPLERELEVPAASPVEGEYFAADA